MDRSYITHRRHNNIQCIGAYTVQGSTWLAISDHLPLWAHDVLPSVHAPTATPLAKVAPREFIELPLTDKEIGMRFAADMDKWLTEAPAWEDGFEAGQFLHRLSTMSTRVTKQIAKGLQRSLRSSFKNGWSPCFVAYKANLTAMLEVRRHLLGQHGRKIWRTYLDASTGIIRIVNHRRAHQEKQLRF